MRIDTCRLMVWGGFLLAVVMAVGQEFLEPRWFAAMVLAGPANFRNTFPPGFSRGIPKGQTL